MQTGVGLGSTWPRPHVVAVASGPAYVGPGNVVANATSWWGLRAYSAAKAGTRAINLRRSSDNATLDFNTLASGALDVASIGTWAGAASLFVTALYDQAGTTDLTQATAANQPAFTLAGLGALPIMTGAGTPQTLFNATGFALTAPFTYFCTFRDTNAGAVLQRVMGQDQVQDTSLTTNGTSNLVGIAQAFTGGGTVSFVNHNVWIAAAGTGNGASSALAINGTDHTGLNSGGTGVPTSGIAIFASYNAQTFYTGSIVEAGAWPGDIAAAGRQNLTSNSKTYWGF